MAAIREVLPKQGLLYHEDVPTTVLCKPKIMPMKSVTLEKLEKIQKEAQEIVKNQETANSFGSPAEDFSSMNSSSPADIASF